MIPLLANASAAGYSAKFLLLPTEFDAPVVAAVVEGKALGTMTIGFACRNSVEAAVVKAWMEAVAIQDTLAGLRDPQPNGASSAPRGLSSFGLVSPREDRAYRLSYAADFSNVTTLFAQLQLSSDPVIAKLIKERLDAEGEREFSGDKLPHEFPRTHSEYLNRIVRRGFECWSCDITTSDVELLGVRVVRVVAPGLLMNFPAAYPPLGSRRALANRPVGVQIDGRSTPQSYYALPLAYA
jgi:ribosomal protein S12 methylthiotransferase accessory factor